MTLAACTTVLVAVLATAPDNPAFERAKEAYAAQRWDEAAAAFGEAYAKDPRPEFLYAKAQAQRLGQRCDLAVKTYQAFIDTEPPQGAIEDARKNIERCETRLQESDPLTDPVPEPEPEPGPEPEPEPAVEPEPVEDRVEARPRRWFADPWGGALTGVGLVIAGTGAGVLVEAHQRQGEAREAVGEAEYLERIDGAPRLSQVGIGLLATGGALLVAAVVRYAAVGVRERRSPVAGRVAVMAGRGGVFEVRW